MEISKTRKICLLIGICCGKYEKLMNELSFSLAFLDFGFIISLQPTFYPTEAEAKGAEPHQVA